MASAPTMTGSGFYAEIQIIFGTVYLERGWCANCLSSPGFRLFLGQWSLREAGVPTACPLRDSDYFWDSVPWERLVCQLPVHSVIQIIFGTVYLKRGWCANCLSTPGFQCWRADHFYRNNKISNQCKMFQIDLLCKRTIIKIQQSGAWTPFHDKTFF